MIGQEGKRGLSLTVWINADLGVEDNLDHEHDLYGLLGKPLIALFSNC